MRAQPRGARSAGERAAKALEVLRAEYSEATITLRFRGRLELLVAVMLSGQTTDAAVNKVTPALFARYRTARDYAGADLRDLERLLRPLGLHRTKARRLKALGRALEERFGGQVPGTMEALLGLPGVARKTANVVLWHGFGRREGIAVDTHAARVAKRLGWTRPAPREAVERALMRLVPREDWGRVTHWLIAHGREVCKAQGPRCEACPLLALCPTGPRLLRARARAPGPNAPPRSRASPPAPAPGGGCGAGCRA